MSWRFTATREDGTVETFTLETYEAAYAKRHSLYSLRGGSTTWNYHQTSNITCDECGSFYRPRANDALDIMVPECNCVKDLHEAPLRRAHLSEVHTDPFKPHPRDSSPSIDNLTLNKLSRKLLRYLNDLTVEAQEQAIKVCLVALERDQARQTNEQLKPLCYPCKADVSNREEYETLKAFAEAQGGNIPFTGDSLTSKGFGVFFHFPSRNAQIAFLVSIRNAIKKGQHLAIPRVVLDLTSGDPNADSPF